MEAVQERQGFMLACLEEIAFRMGYISLDDMKKLADGMLKNDYGQYLIELYNDAKAINS